MDQTLEQMVGQETVFFLTWDHVKAEQARIVEEERQSLLGAWMSRIMRLFVCVVPDSSVLFQYLISMIYDVLIQSIR